MQNVSFRNFHFCLRYSDRIILNVHTECTLFTEKKANGDRDMNNWRLNDAVKAQWEARGGTRNISVAAQSRMDVYQV